MKQTKQQAKSKKEAETKTAREHYTDRLPNEPEEKPRVKPFYPPHNPQNAR